MTEELFNQLKTEQKAGHTPNYSALFHDLDVNTILAVREAKSFSEYKAKESLPVL